MARRLVGLVQRFGSRGLVAGVVALGVAICSGTASATITQGDFSVFGNLRAQWSGRWGEGSARGGVPSNFAALPASTGGVAPTETGGSFDFNHWDLVQARQIADIRPDYHFVKNYNLLGRLDTLVLKDADFFAIYRGWYDAFPDIKHRGRAETARDWTNFTSRDRIDQFVRNDLREYYGQLNFTDNFSVRVGKQQVIWSEADVLSGTDVTNPNDLRFHWLHFEAPEDLRKNLRMVKFNYVLPDFMKTANNELEFFWIPGNYEGPALIFNTTDARNPWVVPAALSPTTGYNSFGQPFRDQLFGDAGAENLFFAPGTGFLQEKIITTQNKLTNSIDNSEFGVRYSTLLPIGNGLQTSLIYLYEAREPKLGYCVNCPAPADALVIPGLTAPPAVPPGTFISISNNRAFFPNKPGVPVGGSLYVFLRQENVRQHFFDVTGTYYDKDLTDIVYRYDFLYAPKVGSSFSDAAIPFPIDSGARWTEETRWIVAGDRPTYIPWLSKQHTFLIAQNTLTWFPDRHDNAVPNFATDVGKLRELSDLTFIAAQNWLINGQWTALNSFAWDWDDNVGQLMSTNSYRYSRNVLFGVNGVWYLGRSGRYTDPYAFSRAQRINEIEFRIIYEI
jgi:hypothetical protein